MDFDALLANENVYAFLRVIRSHESSQDDNAYRMLFGGSLFTAPPWEHPRLPITIGHLTSTAAGAYQIIAKTWDGLVGSFGFQDFSPVNQDRAGIALVAGRGVLKDVLAGNFQDALRKCAKEWASLPGSPYGQPTQSLAQAVETYTQFGGKISEEMA